MTGPTHRPRRQRRRVRVLALAWATLAAAVSAGAAAAQQGQPGCHGAPIDPGVVAAVRDGRSLLLADGREVRLAGIETPGTGLAALQKLGVGQSLRLESAGPGTDRYGRTVAFAFLPETGKSLQEMLLEAGEALVSSRPADKACTGVLLAAERAAQAAKRGHWAVAADPNFAPLSSEDLTKLSAARGHFARVEGKILSVRESGATIYMNFGRRWTRDFTVTVRKARQRTFAAAGIELKQLEGRRIRVRGFIEQRGGPIIDANEPSQIELAD